MRLQAEEYVTLVASSRRWVEPLARALMNVAYQGKQRIGSNYLGPGVREAAGAATQEGHSGNRL